MRVICIDGKPENATFSLPEGVPLEVEDFPGFPYSYRVIGYDYDEIKCCFICWRKRRFIPLSDIDETELIKERQECKTVTQ